MKLYERIGSAAWNHVVPGISYCLFYRFQRPHGVENGDDGHAHIGEHRLPHIGNTGGAERQHQELEIRGFSFLYR